MGQFLQTLDRVQIAAMRALLGALRMSPIAGQRVEANEPPFNLHRLKLSVYYAVKLKCNPSNPAFGCMFPSNLEVHFRACL